MSAIAVARRYAEALADVATARDQVDQIDREVSTFAELLKSNRELRDVFASPIISLADKRRVLDALIERAGPGQMTTNLLRTMLGHHRLHYLPEMREQFRRVINERQGLIVAEVTTAAEVGHDDQQRLGRTLERMTGKRVEFKFKTDPALIGGVVTRIESVVYDGSVRTQLREIKERMKQGESL
jgi:F-type H+-transporting ATPase subunit delta